jgi:exodeoxyribonuclease V gamma subunit
LNQEELNLEPQKPIASNSESALAGRGIVLYGSNDPEELIEQCALDLQRGLSDPFRQEEFLVQSRGMGTWVQLRLADRLGIFARAKFRFPEDTIWMILRGFVEDCPKKNLFTKEVMAWKIFDLLSGRIERDPETFASVARYVGEEEERNGDRTFRLCRQIAFLFDSYLTYRPEIILDWQAGKLPAGGDRWQGLLWKDLRSALDQKSLPELVNGLGSEPSPVNPERMPERLSVFGISTLPPVFLDVLQAYGRFCPLRVYALQPAPVMWGEVESEKTFEKWKLRALERAKGQAERPVGEDELNEERGNPLIGSLGRTGREFFNLLVDRNAHDVPLNFRDPEGDSLLARLQRWTFEVFSAQPEERKPLSEGDESITINSCHGPMREAEVLRDYLLRRFAEDPNLRPRDVVVMMPDPEGYAPYLRATFGGMEEGMPDYFPFSIVDREPRQESQIVDCFFDLLEFFDGRATNREVLDLLDSSVFRTRFELDDEDMKTFRRWIRECHAHWGLDGDHRQNFGSTKTDEHTWRHALDRMALGFCMRGNGERLWEGVLPYDEIEGENALRFAKLSRVVDSLRSLEVQARGDHGLYAWASLLERLTKTFFPKNNKTLLDRRRVSKAIQAIREEFAPLAGKRTVPLRAIRYHLGNVLTVGTTQGRFLTKGVTFCGLRPMRSVSARVVCLIGMNDGAFPRQLRNPSFDLSGDRQSGDRSVREDDRYLFLETLWSAREFLYLSYVGQSIRRNQKIPPSVVVNELLDGLDKLIDYRDTDGEPERARDKLICEQTLHPFGKDNFTSTRLPRSYSSDNLKAAGALLEPDRELPPFVAGPMKQPPVELTELMMDELCKFLENPSKAFLGNRLGMNLWEEDGPPEDSEPLDLTGLKQYVLKDRLLGIELKMEKDVQLYQLEKAEGSLPPGNIGKVWFNEARREVDKFVDLWGVQLNGEKSDPEAFDEMVDGVRLRGELGPFVEGRQLLYRCVDKQKLKGKDRLRAWVRHVFACAFSGSDQVETRLFFLANKFISFPPLDRDVALGHLKEFLGLYRSGMREALPFFPNSSHAYQVERIKSDPPGEEEGEPGGPFLSAIKKARGKWKSSEFNGISFRGEEDDSANKLCFRGEPFDHPDFADLAGRVYGPLLEKEREEAEP